MSSVFSWVALLGIGAGVLVGPSAVGMAAAGERDLTLRCERYRSELVRARVALEHGDRVEAVAALRKAQDALRACAREATQGTSILSAATRLPGAA